jgi:hypothetical protein
LTDYVEYLIRTDVNRHEEISQAEAYRRFGRKTVEKWTDDGKARMQRRGDRSVKYRLRELLEAAINN